MLSRRQCVRWQDAVIDDAMTHHRRPTAQRMRQHRPHIDRPTAPEKPKKSPSIGIFHTPTPTKKVTFGMRYVACRLYITQHLHVSNVPILPFVSIIDPLKVVCHFFVTL